MLILLKIGTIWSHSVPTCWSSLVCHMVLRRYTSWDLDTQSFAIWLSLRAAHVGISVVLLTAVCLAKVSKHYVLLRSHAQFCLERLAVRTRCARARVSIISPTQSLANWHGCSGFGCFLFCFLSGQVSLLTTLVYYLLIGIFIRIQNFQFLCVFPVLLFQSGSLSSNTHASLKSAPLSRFSFASFTHLSYFLSLLNMMWLHCSLTGVSVSSKAAATNAGRSALSIVFFHNFSHLT